MCVLMYVGLMCVFSPCGVVFCRHCLWVVDVVVMGECSPDLHAHTHEHTGTSQTHTDEHTHTRVRGSACIKRPNKRSFPHHQPTADKTSRQKSKTRQQEICVCVKLEVGAAAGGNIFHFMEQQVGSVSRGDVPLPGCEFNHSCTAEGP